jgi:hypothetical protein
LIKPGREASPSTAFCQCKRLGNNAAAQEKSEKRKKNAFAREQNLEDGISLGNAASGCGISGARQRSNFRRRE